MADTSRVMRATSLDANRPSREIRRLSLRWRRRQLECGPKRGGVGRKARRDVLGTGEALMTVLKLPGFTPRTY